MVTRVIASLMLAALCGTLVVGQPTDPQEKDKRTSYARARYFKRFSKLDQVQTAQLGLPIAAASFLNLYFDLARNREDLRAESPPEDKGVTDLPHMRVSAEKDVLMFEVYFQDLELADVALPTKDIPPLLQALASEPVLEHARVQSEGPERTRKVRLLMIAELLRFTEEVRAKDADLERDCRALAPAMCRVALEGLDESHDDGWIAPLEILKRYGDAPSARALAKRLERDGKGLAPDSRARILSAICNMQCPAAEKFLLKILDGDNDTRKARAIRTLERFPGPEAEKRLASFIAPDTKAARKVQGATLRALERIPSEQALTILRDTFRATKDDRRREKIAVALARRGDTEGIGFVMTRFDGMKDDARKFRFACEMAQTGQRWVAPYLRSKVAEAESGKNEKAKAMVPLLKALLKQLDGTGPSK